MNDNEKQVLLNKDIYPSDEVLGNYLLEKYEIYKKFLDETNKLDLVIEWHFYNDGKTWLGKILNKKKNLGWLSVWNTGFKITVFLTEKTLDGFNVLEINDQIKKSIKLSDPLPRLIPVVMRVDNISILMDIITILTYMKKVKK